MIYPLFLLIKQTLSRQKLWGFAAAGDAAAG
jgi:hypothetical protein